MRLQESSHLIQVKVIALLPGEAPAPVVLSAPGFLHSGQSTPPAITTLLASAAAPQGVPSSTKLVAEGVALFEANLELDGILVENVYFIKNGQSAVLWKRLETATNLAALRALKDLGLKLAARYPARS